MRHEMHSEKLTVLPKRFETRKWGHGHNGVNFALVGQNNTSIQTAGVGVGIDGEGTGSAENVLQLNKQANLAFIFQK